MGRYFFPEFVCFNNDVPVVVVVVVVVVVGTVVVAGLGVSNLIFITKSFEF